METERQTWLPALEPPAGGPERFRRRLRQARPSTSKRNWRFAAGVAAVTLTMAVTVFIAISSREQGTSEGAAEVYQAESFDRLLGRPLAPTETSVTIDQEIVRVSRLDNSNPKVRIYRVD